MSHPGYAAIYGQCSGSNIGIDDVATSPTYYSKLTQPVTTALANLGTTLTLAMTTNSAKQTSSVAQAIDGSTKLKIKAASDSTKGVTAQPNDKSKMAPIKTTRGPFLSANAPASGCTSPQANCPMAKAKLILDAELVL